MKSFVASLIILAVLMICSVLNCIYIDKVTAKLLDLEACFPEKLDDSACSPALAIEQAEELWESAKPRLLCAAKAGYITAVTAALYNTCDYYEHGSSADYIAARRILVEAITALRISDSLNFSSII